MTAIDPSGFKSRQEADVALAHYVEMPGVRQFLLKNLERIPTGESGAGGFRWRINVPVIEACYPNLAAAPEGDAFEGPTLFIKGADSAYIQDKHRDEIARLFPKAELQIIEGTGHWLHAEQPDRFAELCRRFLAA